MRLFVFGTLMDPDVREIVMGKAWPPEAIEPAVAQGFRRVFVAGRHYPMLLAHASGWVDGTLVSGLDQQTLHRLQVYEGWEYSLRPIRVRTGAGRVVMAHVFLCPPHISADKREWRLDLWQRRHKRPFLRKAEALMRGADRPVHPAHRPALAPRGRRR